MEDLSKYNFLITGQLKTSRTEILEDYLRERVHSLGVIGLMSPFAAYNESRSTLYKQGIKIREFPLSSFVIKRVTRWKRPLMCISFIVYILVVLFAVRRFKHKFDYYIGIATFSAMLGVFLRRTGAVSKIIYYCIDYYPSPKKIGFNSFVNIIYKNIDVWLLKRADIVWEISPRIKEARQRYTGFFKESHNHVIVPLGYSNNIHSNIPLGERERWTLGFVGTLSENQGMQLVIEAMPYLAKKFPEIKVRVIGHGPYSLDLKELSKKLKVEDRFIFHGFVRDDNEAYDILSHCMAGLATWTGDETDNSLYADPGKPKLYALLGLPIIITSAPYVSKIITETGAGEVIEYNVNDFILAVEKIIESEEHYLLYIKGVEKFKPYCLAKDIFDNAFMKLA